MKIANSATANLEVNRFSPLKDSLTWASQNTDFGDFSSYFKILLLAPEGFGGFLISFFCINPRTGPIGPIYNEKSEFGYPEVVENS